MVYKSCKLHNLKITALLQYFMGGGIQIMNGDLQQCKSNQAITTKSNLYKYWNKQNTIFK